MKKSVLFATALAVATLSFTGCGQEGMSLNTAIQKGNDFIKKGMSKEAVRNVVTREPDSVQKLGDYELWTYEGVVTNEQSETSKYKNFTIRFKDGVVDFVGYFGCKLPKIED